ncbi:tetratricopeptide repeat protein [Ferruginibacter albus]|uniref:tetratricopeptide repeat protein n=1 Tax=Ferruginibacter albus TaxID=2875540 RepID=UPI001CC4C412|nr:tetratricopeptide repeat protein [Ferruginibacter albus]UAY53475.1 tetratricopeptide repeat protein [Ferruginibacter albus]
MTKWITIFLLLCQCAFAQPQLTAYVANSEKQNGNKIFAPNNGAYRALAILQNEDTATSDKTISAEDISRSLKEYKKALALTPNDTLLLYQIGHCFASGDTPEKDSALKYYNKAIDKSKAFYDAYLGRGYLYALLFGNFRKAHKDFDKSIEIKPMNQYAYLYSGMLYFNERDYQKAKAMYDKAIALYPDFGEAYYERSKAWYEIGVNTMVCKDLDTASKLGFAKAEEDKKIYCQ